MALRKDNQALLGKLFVKECVQEYFRKVLNKADGYARDAMFLRETIYSQNMKQSSNMLSTSTS